MPNVLSLYGLLALTASVLAQSEPNPDFDPIYVPGEDQKVEAGKTLRITWQAKENFQDDLISLSLIGGPETNRQTPVGNGPFAEHIPNRQQYYDWLVDPTLGDRAVYGLVITSESKKGVFQYSNHFHIVGGEKVEPSGSETTHLTTTATQTKTLHLSSLSQSSGASYATPSTSASVRNATASSLGSSSSCNCTTVVRTRPVSSMVLITSTPVAPTSAPSKPTGALAPVPAASSAGAASAGASASAMPSNVTAAAATTPMVKTGSIALLLGLVLALLA